VIIPVFGILSSGIGTHTITALSPFIYVAIGFLYGGSWWFWGWMIIPISGILFSSGHKKKKKKKKKWKTGYTYIFEESVDEDIDATMQTVEQSIDAAMQTVEQSIDAAMNVYDDKDDDKRN
jgi:hypothetical protein